MQLELSAGADTERLLSFITNELEESDLDSMEVDRTFEAVEGLATEPVTVAAIITASGAIVATIATLVAKWPESRRQKETIQLLIKGYKESPAAGDAILKLATSHAGVRVTSADVK
jgi:hypothetical protein